MVNRTLRILIVLLACYIAIEGRKVEAQQSLIDLGSHYWQQGQYERALSAWEQQVAESESLGEEDDSQTELKLRIASARLKLNQNTVAVALLEKLATKATNPILSSKIQNQLGNAYLLAQNREKAAIAYQKSSAVYPNVSAFNNLAWLHFQQVMLARRSQKFAREETVDFYVKAEQDNLKKAREAAKSALNLSREKPPNLTAIKTVIQWQSIMEQQLSDRQLERVRKILLSLPPSREKILSLVEWAEIDTFRRNYWLELGLQESRQLNDSLSRSYILLRQAEIAETAGDLERASKLADTVVSLAELRDGEISYRAFWLKGRINRAMRPRVLKDTAPHIGVRRKGTLIKTAIAKDSTALDNYHLAIAARERLSLGIDKISLSRRLDFASEIEPMYRQTLELLLENNPSQARLTEAIEISQKLKIAQLQTFFGDNCLEIVEDNQRRANAIEESGKRVTIHSILLDDSTHFILQQADGSYVHHDVKIEREQIETRATNWYRDLESGYSNRYQEGSRFFYHLMIAPFESQIKEEYTIVFVHDGILRNLPMTALLDERDIFLAQKWVSISSLGLINVRLKSFWREKIEVAAFALESSVDGRFPLERAEDEVRTIVDLVSGTVSINADFNQKNLQEKLQAEKYNILHLATHGYFGGLAENSFILSFESQITALELEQILLSSSFPIELLVLSACETALGDDLSVLGLSGLVLRSGVGSVLGTLWFAQDIEQADLMRDFYAYLGSALEKDYAVALNKVQRKYIAEKKLEPRIWAAVSLIEN